LIRLNKYLSKCGVTSRRGADILITEGRVTVNNEKVEQLGISIDEETDKVKVDNIEVSPVTKKEYIVFNKPTNVLTTLDDPFKRKTISNYLKDLPNRLFPVGRLDYDTSGVLLLTNDGDLAYALTHPKFQIPKVYLVRVKGKFLPSDAIKIEKGIELEDGAIGKGKVEIIKHSKLSSQIKITLREGRKREVKQMCKAVWHPVLQLQRVEFAGINAERLKKGEWRYLTTHEINRLKKITSIK
jgi:pseudouridine synthase